MGLPLPKMSLQAFLAWEDTQPERHEFLRGEVFARAGGTARHNRVTLNLAARIADHLDGSGCQVFAENMKVQIADGVLYPDVMVSCGKALAGDELIIDDLKLVIEVLSPSTKGYDKRDKFILYRSLSSLREYALVDPAARQIEVLTLTSNGWLLSDQSAATELVLTSIDLRIPTGAVFKGVVGEAA